MFAVYVFIVLFVVILIFAGVDYHQTEKRTVDSVVTSRMTRYVDFSVEQSYTKETPAYQPMHWGDKGTVSAWFVNPEVILIERSK